MAEPRIVSFDLMSDDPDWYFVLTTALKDFAACERAEAEHDDKEAARIRWAETAEDAIYRIEAALARQSADKCLAWCKGCRRATASLPCELCEGLTCAECGRCPACDGEGS